ncbi:MAG: MATE family efflux transporter [Vicinamibacteraceae bacterium]|nr:MATE family efflux transporter [Vicinamibacteraceae bacterium]
MTVSGWWATWRSRVRAGGSRADYRETFRRLIRLALPVVVAELGWMSMGLVDTVMVGPLGPAAIGAVGLGSSAFMAVAIFAMGLLLGLDTLVSQHFGAGQRGECHRWLLHGLVLGGLVALPLAGLVWLLVAWLPHSGLTPEVRVLVVPYLAVLQWSLVPLIAYAAERRYLQGMSLVRPVTFALVSANLVNAAANYALIYGHFGLPPLGVAGAAWATLISRAYMAAVLAAAVWHVNRRERPSLAEVSWRIEWARLRRLFAIGLPAATQITLEVGVFAAATALAGYLDAVSLAAHQIALNIAAFTFMVPLGMASAGAVLVGQAVGARSGEAAARAGWVALGTIAAFMLGVAVIFVAAPRLLLGVFTDDGALIWLGARLLAVAAVFQLFDGLQGVATGVLRGIGDTQTPMRWNLVAHWAVGFPVGYLLCFPLGFGVLGLWIGLSIGLILVGAVLVATWARRGRVLRGGAVEAFVA